MLLKWWCKRGL